MIYIKITSSEIVKNHSTSSLASGVWPSQLFDFLNLAFQKQVFSIPISRFLTLKQGVIYIISMSCLGQTQYQQPHLTTSPFLSTSEYDLVHADSLPSCFTQSCFIVFFPKNSQAPAVWCHLECDVCAFTLSRTSYVSNMTVLCCSA